MSLIRDTTLEPNTDIVYVGFFAVQCKNNIRDTVRHVSLSTLPIEILERRHFILGCVFLKSAKPFLALSNPGLYLVFDHHSKDKATKSLGSAS